MDHAVMTTRRLRRLPYAGARPRAPSSDARVLVGSLRRIDATPEDLARSSGRLDDPRRWSEDRGQRGDELVDARGEPGADVVDAGVRSAERAEDGLDDVRDV